MKKEEENGTNCSELKYKIAKIKKMRKVEVIPVVIETLGPVTKHLENWTELDDWSITEALFTWNIIVTFSSGNNTDLRVKEIINNNINNYNKNNNNNKKNDDGNNKSNINIIDNNNDSNNNDKCRYEKVKTTLT